ncbi:MAG TPA: hypothetical protein VEU74_09590 [Gemmatimonadales bacterium]|nr:hypothetical protein [Gemmatimonadales bacterium]
MVGILPLIWLLGGPWRDHGTDSLAVLKAARRAQQVFEATRRANLPQQPSSASGACDERIGRMCYWYEGGLDTAPEEPPRIRDARVKLLATLADAGEALPGDEWIAGQRVRYLIEHQAFEAAVRVAMACRATLWWCEALSGMAWHAAGDFAGADSAFAAALRDMPEEERCQWTDISPLLEGALAKQYGRLDCAGRETFAARWWWLTRPLYSLDGNDRRTEHYARRTFARIERDARTTFGLYWGDDLRDLLVRYGWATYWTRDPPRSDLVPSEPRIAGHEPSPSFRFAPAPRAFDDPGAARPEDWALDARQARERYAPDYARAFVGLDHQAAIFRRDDSCIVVGAYDLSGDTLFAEDSVRGALVVAADEQTVALSRDSGRVTGTRALTATAPCQPFVLSLEAVAPRERHVARVRYGVAPPSPRPDQVEISDLLLFDPRDSLPDGLSAVIPEAHGSTRFSAPRRLGVFWELYGVGAGGAPVTMALTVTREGGGWLRRAVQSLGLVGAHRNVRLEWQEVPQPGPVTPRSLVVDLSDLASGRYVIEVAVAPAEGDKVTARREITVAR